MTSGDVDLTRDEILMRLDVPGFYAEFIPDFRINGAVETKTWCLFHKGRTKALSINRGTGLFHCHSCDAAGSPVDFLMRLHGWSAGEALRHLRERVSVTGRTEAADHKAPSEATPRRRLTSIPEMCDDGTKVALYEYTLDDGAGRAVKVRYARADGSKTFRWYERDRDTFLETLGGRTADIYQFATVRKGIERGALVILNEGEKACDRAAMHDGDDSLDFVATCGPNGSGSFRKEAGARLAAQLAGAPEVLVVVDRDKAGARLAEEVRRHLESRVARLRFAKSAVESHAADLYDHLEAGHSISELVSYSATSNIGDPSRTGGAPSSFPSAATGAIAAVVEIFRRWQYLPDPRGLYAVLGTYAANRSDGDPVWLLVVGPSGSGKTEIVQTLTGLPDIYPASTLTAASLLSGTPKRNKAKEAKGGLLRQIGDFGIILCKDFTSVLSMHRDARSEVLAALREVYDGSYVRHLGTDGGLSLAWSGRVGFVGGVTPTIDRHVSVMATMGERFLLFRMPDVDRKELTRRALGHTRKAVRMRTELADAVVGLFTAIDLSVDPPALSQAETETLIGLADFVATARSPVERDGYKREIELIPGAEAPTRIAITLAQLFGGLRTVGVPNSDAWLTVRKVALDCVPATRLAVLKAIDDGTDWSTKAVAECVGYPTGTTHRILEDLSAHHLVTRASEGVGHSDKWRKNSDFAVGETSPEMSEGVRT